MTTNDDQVKRAAKASSLKGTRSVREYIDELERKKGEKPQQVKEAIELYVGLWEKAIDRGVVAEQDEIDGALSKIEAAGGLYAAAEE